MSEGRFEVMEGLPEDVVGIVAHGKLTRAAYEGDLIPLIEARIAKEGKVKLLYVLGEAFEGFTAGAAWEDTKVGLLHLADFAKIAVVSDAEWIRMGVKLFAPMLRAPVSVFALDDLDAAKAWICANGAPERHGHDVAADHKIPPLEDKGPVG